MLVAPPDLHSAPGALPALASFTPVPTAPLPYPSLVIASENDPHAGIEAAAEFARNWGSEFVNVGAAGHINVDSGHGPWPDGERHFQRFKNQVCSPACTAAGS
jgi:predicted alpha/beta hydrolase family esterase